MDQIEQEIKRLKELEKTLETETKEQATNRISQELKDERKLKERRDCVMDYFFMYTGVPMTEEQFTEYNILFNIPDIEGQPKRVYNLKTYIRDKGIKLTNDGSLKQSPIEEFNAFCEKEDIKEDANEHPIL
jgi:hypothetical protein